MANMVNQDDKVTNPMPVMPELTKPSKQANSQSSLSQTPPQSGSRSSNASDPKLSPKKRARIDAKYQGKRLKNESKYQQKCERLDQEHPNERDVVRHTKQQKIDEKARKKGHKIDAKHEKKIDRAEKRAKLDGVEMPTGNHPTIEDVATEKKSRRRSLKDTIKGFATTLPSSGSTSSSHRHSSTPYYPVAAPVTMCGGGGLVGGASSGSDRNGPCGADGY